VSNFRFGGIALVILIGLFWGLNWPAVKFILGEVPPWTLRAIGMSSGAVLLAGLAVAFGQSLRLPKEDRVRLVIAGLFSILGFNVLTAFGQLHTQTSTAAIIAFTMPMWTAILSILFLKERLNTRRTGSLLLGMSGLLVLVSEDLGGFLSQPIGPLFMLGAAVSWAAGTVALKSRQWSIKPIAQAAWMLGVSSPPAILAALTTEYQGNLVLPSMPVLLTMAYHVLLPMVFCYVAWSILVSRLPASVASMGTLLVPIVGVFSAGLILGEDLSLQKLAALALVLASIVLTFARVNRAS
jgi:drug/metabolite transporter (DMT)-like permease